MKNTKAAYFINGLTEPPQMGFEITWYDVYSEAVNSTEDYSGYFKVGNPNIMILSELDLPVDEVDISGEDAFSMVFNTTEQLRISDTSINDIRGVALKSLSANNTQYKKAPSMQDNSYLRMDSNSLDASQVDAIVNSMLVYDDQEPPVAIGARPNMVLENDENSIADPASITLIQNAGGQLYEIDKGYLQFQTDAAVATGFQMHIHAGANVNWYENNALAAANTNNHTFFFTDSSVKTIRVGGDDVANANYILLGSKSLTGTCDLSAMLSASYRIDVSANPNLTELILPNSEGIFDQFLGYGCDLRNVAFQKLPNMVNATSVQIRLNDNLNLETNQVVRNILSVDKGIAAGRILFLSNTPALDTELRDELILNGWSVV